MGLINWIDRRMMGLETITDYGDVYAEKFSLGNRRGSLLLCRRKSKLLLAFRMVVTSLFGAGVQYFWMDATPENLRKLKAAIADAEGQLQSQSLALSQANTKLPPRL